MGDKIGLVALASMALLAACGILDPTPRSGIVTGPGAVPLPGVVVAAGDTSAVTGPDGRWALATRAWSATFRKPGFEPRQATLPSERVALDPAGRPLKMVADERFAGPPLEGIKTWLASQRVEVAAVASGQLPSSDTILLAAPSFYSSSALQETLDQVRAGTTLILAGEWGGASRADLPALDRLAGSAGIRFTGSLVRDPASDLSRSDWIVPEFLVDLGISPGTVRLASAGVLSAVPPAQILARSGGSSYRVSMWQRGSQVVAAYGPLGGGKVVAIADASWLADDQAKDPARPGWQDPGNSALALALARF